MLRLDLNTVESSPLVKMFAYYHEVGTCRAQTSPTTTLSLSDEVKINLNMLGMLMLYKLEVM
jgi:hypothetical protein